MLRFLIVRLLLPLALFLFLRSLLRSIFAGPRPAAGPQARNPQPPKVPAGGELKKDPVCGTYVSAAAGFAERINGETVHFCSKECRDRYHS